MKKMLHACQWLMMTGIFELLPLAAISQTADKEFSVATLNVDGWVEACQQGIYPEMVSGDRYMAYDNGEVLDKILYINPLKGPRLELKSYQLETDYTYEDGTPMGDHFPVSVTFRIIDDTSGICQFQLDTSSPQQIWSIDGRSQSKLRKGLNIVRSSDGSIRKVVLP